MLTWSIAHHLILLTSECSLVYRVLSESRCFWANNSVSLPVQSMATALNQQENRPLPNYFRTSYCRKNSFPEFRAYFTVNISVIRGQKSLLNQGACSLQCPEIGGGARAIAPTEEAYPGSPGSGWQSRSAWAPAVQPSALWRGSQSAPPWAWARC